MTSLKVFFKTFLRLYDSKALWHGIVVDHLHVILDCFLQPKMINVTVRKVNFP